MVTAAHCQFSVSRFLVVLGEHDLAEDEDTELRMVPASWTSHPLYNPRYHPHPGIRNVILYCQAQVPMSQSSSLKKMKYLGFPNV